MEFSSDQKFIIQKSNTFDFSSSENDETEVICEVHSQPRAEVTWFKNGIELSKEKVIINHRDNKHVLILPGIKNTFGIFDQV